MPACRASATPLLTAAARGALITLLLPLTGCLVPQPRGDGSLDRIIEPQTQRAYWRYLPAAYVAAERDSKRGARRWPLVVSCHGMKPFDTAPAQAREWQQEADRYGYVVIAPEMRSPDVTQQFPVRSVHPSFKEDAEFVLTAMDHVTETTGADGSCVLATSWSSGGYMAHYLVNRYPERFHCLAVRLSNFSDEVLDAELTPRSRYHPVLIVNTQLDFEIVRAESRQAREWYQRHGYRNLSWVTIKDIGHERTPDLAADFFSRVASVRPMTRPSVLARRQAIDGNREGVALLSGRMARFAKAPAGAESRSSRAAGSRDKRTDSRDAKPAPQRRTPPIAAAAPDGAPLAIGVSTRVGVEPVLLGYWAEYPDDAKPAAQFAWTLNGEPIGTGPNGQHALTRVGDHKLELTAVLADGSTQRASRLVSVLPRVASTPVAAGN